MARIDQVHRILDGWYLLRHGGTRIGDARRDEVAAHLATGRALGFFTEPEFEHLTEIALSARYEHELDWVTGELESVPKQLPHTVPAAEYQAHLKDKAYWDEVHAAARNPNPDWWYWLPPIAVCLFFVVIVFLEATGVIH